MDVVVVITMINFLITHQLYNAECFDTVGWAAGTASGL